MHVMMDHWLATFAAPQKAAEQIFAARRKETIATLHLPLRTLESDLIDDRLMISFGFCGAIVHVTSIDGPL